MNTTFRRRCFSLWLGSERRMEQTTSTNSGRNEFWRLDDQRGRKSQRQKAFFTFWRRFCATSGWLFFTQIVKLRPSALCAYVSATFGGELLAVRNFTVHVTPTLIQPIRKLFPLLLENGTPARIWATCFQPHLRMDRRKANKCIHLHISRQLCGWHSISIRWTYCQGVGWSFFFGRMAIIFLATVSVGAAKLPPSLHSSDSNHQ